MILFAASPVRDGSIDKSGRVSDRSRCVADDPTPECVAQIPMPPDFNQANFYCGWFTNNKEATESTLHNFWGNMDLFDLNAIGEF